MNQKYICHSCLVMFEVQGKKLDNRPYCVECGDSVDVRKHLDRYKPIEGRKIHWTDEEIQKLDKCIDEGVELYYAAIILKRSYNSTKMKMKRRKQERGLK